MSTITLMRFKTIKNIEEIEETLNKVSDENFWFIATKENEKILKIVFNYKISLEDELRKVLKISEIRKLLNGNSLQQISRNIIAYMHFDKEVLEVRRGLDHVLIFFINKLERAIKIKFIPYYISPTTLINIINKYTISLNQIYFKFINGLIFEMYKGKYLQYSDIIKKKLEEYSKNVRIITIVPRIKFNDIQKSITINGDKGTIKFYSNKIIKNELDQIINMIIQVANNEYD